jgi:hypothetical protein
MVDKGRPVDGSDDFAAAQTAAVGGVDDCLHVLVGDVV